MNTLKTVKPPNDSHKLTGRYSVLTKNGFKKFGGIKRTIHATTVKLTFSDGTDITCSLGHRFNLKDDEFITAKKLMPGDVISGKTIISVHRIDGETELFDLLNVADGNHYITSGVTSHNCAFIRSTVWDEFADSIFPSQSGLAWKKNIILSTANGMNHFYQMVKGAKDGSNGMNIYEVNWKDVPRYNPDGSVMKPEEFMEKIVKKHGIIYFNQNYANEFLGSSHTLISSEKLSIMTPREVQRYRDRKLKVYHEPEPGHKYIMSVDPAKDGTDAFAIQIVDITDFEFVQVASAQLQIDYLLMPEFINEWGRDYNNAYLIIENNEGAGQSIADQLYQGFEYDNIHFDKDVGRNKKKKYPGFRTTSKSRKQVLQTLKLFIENDKLRISDKSTINEFYQFILVNGKFQADDGAHDDMVMSLALVFAPFCDTKNFEDMRKVVQRLYMSMPDDIRDDDSVGFGDMLSIGDFDSATDDDYDLYMNKEKKEYASLEDVYSDSDGLF